MVSCPNIIQTYSENARGVDLLDQMISYYEIKHRSKKWYTGIRLVLHFLHIAAHNSFIIYSHSKACSNKINYLNFLKSIIRSLVFPMRMRPALKFTPGKKKNEAIELEPNQEDCLLEFSKQKNCEICNMKGLRKRTTVIYLIKGCFN